jgi:hypothetical protein
MTTFFAVPHNRIGADLWQATTLQVALDPGGRS